MCMHFKFWFELAEEQAYQRLRPSQIRGLIAAPVNVHQIRPTRHLGFEASLGF